MGQTILNTITAIHQVVGKNTYLGTVMLLAPLAAVPREIPLDEGIGDVLDNLSISDTETSLQGDSYRFTRRTGQG